MTQRTFIDAFSYIRILACFFIILLHTLFASNVYFQETITGGELLATKIAENLLMWAVPCFLMVTGVLLLDPDRELPLEKVFRRYLRRVALALVVCVLLFQALDVLAGEEPSFLAGLAGKFFLGQSWPHLWYLYLMIGLYLMMPFYRMVVKGATDRELDILILMLLLFTSVLPMASVAGLQLAFYIPTSLVYPIYVFAGYRLFQRPLSRALAAGTAGCSTILLIAVTCLAYRTDLLQPAWLDTLCGYASPLVVAQSLGLFSLLSGIRRPASKSVRTVDKCTFGIYLIHMIGIRALMKWWGFDPYTYGPLMFALLPVGLFLLSLGLTWALRRVPGVDMIL